MPERNSEARSAHNERDLIATVTVNPALDKTVRVPGFTIGKTNRATIERIDVGGKGINVAQAVKQFGCPVAACGFLAGRNGRYISEVLVARGIEPHFIDIEGETRVNLKIADPDSGTLTEVNEPGFVVDDDSTRRLDQELRLLAPRCLIIVFSGSLPPGVPDDFYRTGIEAARAGGARTILDANGAALRKALAARPDLVKPNRAELEELVGPARDEHELIGSIRQIQRLGCDNVVVSLGSAGAVWTSGEELLRARAPRLYAMNPTGAGDAMVGALAFAMVKNMSARDAFRLATAAGSASAAATTGHLATLDQIRMMMPRIVIEKLL